jgi:hypothetical protein
LVGLLVVWLVFQKVDGTVVCSADKMAASLVEWRADMMVVHLAV